MIIDKTLGILVTCSPQKEKPRDPKEMKFILACHTPTSKSCAFFAGEFSYEKPSFV